MIGLIGRPLLYFLAIVAGVLVTAVCVIAAKSIGRRAPAEVEAPPEAATAAG